MQATVRGGLSYALSAPGFWSHDIGGFFGPELTAGLYVRWTQLGALSPLMRAHGLRPREPWEFGERTLEIARDWIRLRYALLPYLWQVAHESAARGWPVMRPLSFAHPDDPVAAGVDDAFLLGSDLLVCPVFDDRPEPVRRRFYVPRGRWTDWFTGEVFHGPAFHTALVPLERMPLLVRDGAAIPTVQVDASVRGTDDLAERPWSVRTFGERDGQGPHRFIGFDGSTVRL
jgi:alpha-D-xyloside xylohydrolase